MEVYIEFPVIEHKCPHCGNVIDRDYQAALNLKRYGEMVLEQSVI